MRAIVKLGEILCGQCDQLRYVAAVIGTVLYVCPQVRNWKRPIRKAFAEQFLRIGVEPAVFVCGVALLAGITVVVQLAFWTSEAGQSQLLGPLLVSVVARELGPLLTNIVVIVRSSSGMAAELGVLKVSGGIRALEAQGVDPFLYIVMPRVLAMGVATFCLTITFLLVTFSSGYLFGAWLGKGSRDLSYFANTVLHALRPQDMLSILAKSILPALFTSASCCLEGLGVGESIEDLPRATQRALTRSTAGLFVISAAASLLAYL